MVPYLAAAIPAALIAGLFIGVGIGEDREYAAQKRTEESVREVLRKRSLSAAEEIARLEGSRSENTQTMVNEITGNAVYRECHHTDAGMSAIQDSLGGRGPTDRRELP